MRTLHTNTPVKAGQRVAGTRIIPLVVHREILEEARSLIAAHYPILAVKEFRPRRAALIITGNEVYEGLVEDRFAPIMRKKLASYGSSLVETHILPDDVNCIAAAINASFKRGADILITTGGMSVDPDDVTRLAISRAGVERLYYGAGALPGSMILLACKGRVPIMGVPACALYHEATIVDLILPRLLAGEQPAAMIWPAWPTAACAATATPAASRPAPSGSEDFAFLSKNILKCKMIKKDKTNVNRR